MIKIEKDKLVKIVKESVERVVYLHLLEDRRELEGAIRDIISKADSKIRSYMEQNPDFDPEDNEGDMARISKFYSPSIKKLTVNRNIIVDKKRGKVLDAKIFWQYDGLSVLYTVNWATGKTSTIDDTFVKFV